MNIYGVLDRAALPLLRVVVAAFVAAAISQGLVGLAQADAESAERALARANESFLQIGKAHSTTAISGHNGGSWVYGGGGGGGGSVTTIYGDGSVPVPPGAVYSKDGRFASCDGKKWFVNDNTFACGRSGGAAVYTPYHRPGG